MTMTGFARHSTAPSDLNLVIQQFHCRFVLPDGVEHPSGVVGTLADWVPDQVAAACSQVLQALPGDDAAVYRIRHLHLNFWVDWQGMAEPDIVQRWGRLLAQAVTQAMQRGNSQTVRRFESPIQFISAFLQDLLDGRAWSCWYYEEFRPLERLNAGAIALQLLILRPTWFIPIWADLTTTGHAERLMARWATNDITQLWTALGLPTQPQLTAMPEHLPDLWQQVPLQRGDAPVSRMRDRLRLWLALMLAAPSTPSAATQTECASAAHALVDLAALVQRFPDVATTLAMQSGLYPALMRQIADSPLTDTLPWLVPLSQRDPDRRHLSSLVELARVNQTRSTHLPTSRTSAEVGTTPTPTETVSPLASIPQTALTSPVGSVFLLMPALVASGYWQRWLQEEGEERARRYLFLVALKALGRSQAPLMLGDRALATFAGLAQPPIADAREAPAPDPIQAGMAIPDWINALPPVATQWYPERDRQLLLGTVLSNSMESSGESDRESSTVSNLHILKDSAARHWLGAFPVECSAPCWHSFPVDVAHSPSKAEQATLAAEAAHLQLGQRLGYAWLTPTLDAALSAVTSLILRRTATRLPGFHQASLPYLAQQFLAQPATLHPATDALAVNLSGGPLAVVVRMADLPGAIAVPWLPISLRFTQSG